MRHAALFTTPERESSATQGIRLAGICGRDGIATSLHRDAAILITPHQSAERMQTSHKEAVAVTL
jgi:hypothetical protein